MKQLIVILAIIALISCDTETKSWYKFGEESSSPPHDHSKMDNLRYFYQTFFGQYKLSRPNQILDCFCDKTADLFFQSLYDSHQILIDTNERNSIKLHLEFAKLMLTYRPLHDVFACIAMTQDFTDLLDALDIKQRNPRDFMIAKYVYYQAEYPSLVENFQPVIDGLDNKNHSAAGKAYANVIGDLVHSVKKEGLNYLAWEGFENGIVVRLDIENPTDILKCFDNEAAGNYLEFLYKMSEYVSEGKYVDAPYNANRFWYEVGEKLMKKIQDEVLECVKKSEDNQLIKKQLGIDVESREFLDLMLKYIGENRLHFFWMMKSLKHSFDHFNLNHAGYVYGHFLEQIAKSK